MTKTIIMFETRAVVINVMNENPVKDLCIVVAHYLGIPIYYKFIQDR